MDIREKLQKIVNDNNDEFILVDVLTIREAINEITSLRLEIGEYKEMGVDVLYDSEISKKLFKEK